MTDDLSRLMIYRRILARTDPDDARRIHHRTQEASPRQAQQWLRRIRSIHTTLRLVQHDERFHMTDSEAPLAKRRTA